MHNLIFAHAHLIAYESLDIVLGRTPRLDLDSVQRKMISGGRGGDCLEQNMLFREGLRSFGYKITSLQGRVVRGPAIDAPSPAIHPLSPREKNDSKGIAEIGGLIGEGLLAGALAFSACRRSARSSILRSTSVTTTTTNRRRPAWRGLARFAELHSSVMNASSGTKLGAQTSGSNGSEAPIDDTADCRNPAGTAHIAGR